MISLDTSFKTAAAFRHKMLPCFGLRPPRGNARHTLVCQRRPRPHTKTAAACRHKMLPCFGLRPPRGNARHTLVCQSRPRPHTTRLCPRPRPMRKLSDLPLPTRNPSRQSFITAFLTPIRVSQKFTRRDNIRICPWGRSERADMSIIELALSTMCGWCVFSVVSFCIVCSTMRDIRGCQF